MVTRNVKNMTLAEAVDGIFSHQASKAKEHKGREREKEEIEKKCKEYYEAHMKKEMERLNTLVDWYKFKLDEINNTKRSHTQLDSRKQIIAFQDRVITINIKEAQHPLKREKQVIDKSSIMLKISTKSMHRVLV